MASCLPSAPLFQQTHKESRGFPPYHSHPRRKGEIAELKEELNSLDKQKKKDAVKKGAPRLGLGSPA